VTQPDPTSSRPLHIEVSTDSQIRTNSYLVEDERTKDAAVIDANTEPEAMIDTVRGRGSVVRAILLTHTDIDHIAGLSRLREAWGDDVPIAVHDAERHVISQGQRLRREHNHDSPGFEKVESLAPGELYHAGSLAFLVLPTPGHSPGGVTLRLDGLLFTGDALFAGTIGRHDFANSDPKALVAGIRDQLLSLPDECVVLPGHGPRSTIGQERRSNPFLRE
jgi:hydroxyacylglutathione hydrolase